MHCDISLVAVLNVPITDRIYQGSNSNLLNVCCALYFVKVIIIIIMGITVLINAKQMASVKLSVELHMRGP